MRPLPRLRTALTLIVIAVITLEVLHWLRPLAVAQRAAPLPTLMIAADGAKWFRRYESRAGERAGEWRTFAIDCDVDGRFLRDMEFQSSAPGLRDVLRVSPFGRWWLNTTPGVKFDAFQQSRFWRQGDWFDDVADRLTALRWRGAARGAPGISGRSESWSFRDGRFVCVDRATNEVLGSFGPDGFSEEAPADGERFDRTRWQLATSRLGDMGTLSPLVLVDVVGRSVLFVSFDEISWREARIPNAQSDIRSPMVTLRLTSVPVEGPNGEPPEAMPDLPTSAARWNQCEFLERGFDDVVFVYVRAGSELVAVRRSGILHRAPLDPGEAELQRWDEKDNSNDGAADVITTVLPPIDPARPHMRIRRWRDDGTLDVEDARAPLTTTGAVVADFLGCAPSLVRPPILCAVSFATPGPANFDEYSDRWLLDADVAGGARIGVLAASMVVAALCSIRARRQARLRCSTEREVRFWTTIGAALGIAGLIWMRIVVPRSHVAACPCGRRRAVHVETCPACASRWPAPVATGIEVFA